LTDPSFTLAVASTVFLLVVAGALLFKYRRKRKPRPTPAPTPIPTIGSLPPCETPLDRVNDILRGVYHPSRLSVMDRCSYGKGTVTLVKKELDGDWHIDIAPDPDSLAHAHGHPTLVSEITPYDQSGGGSGLNLSPPNVGDRVAVYGPYVFDTIHGWAEIHPIHKILKI
jgi:hypothetical protein